MVAEAQTRARLSHTKWSLIAKDEISWGPGVPAWRTGRGTGSRELDMDVQVGVTIPNDTA
jgi:hypothetical protein